MLQGKTAWYRGRKTTNKGEEKPTLTMGGRSRKKIPHKGADKKGGGADNLKTRAVIFVEQTPRGELASILREQLNGMGATLGFKLRVMERTRRKYIVKLPPN